MTDRMTSQQRSYTMSRIRSRRNRSTELRFVEQMRSAGVTGWRRNAAVFGHPDVVFAKARIAVFLDGCFWHGCPRCFAMPRSNVAYWRGKIAGNRNRDARIRATLRVRGWTVVRIWEHALRHDVPYPVSRLRRVIAEARHAQ